MPGTVALIGTNKGAIRLDILRFQRRAILRRADQRFGGGVKPPNSRSISPANAIVVRSSR